LEYPDHAALYKRDALNGIRDGLLFAPLYLSLAVPYAVLALSSGFGAFKTVLWSGLSFACSAQVACLKALGTHAGLIELLIITFMINVRHGFVGLAISPFLGKSFRRWSLVLFCFTIATSSAGLIPLGAARAKSLTVYGLAVQLCQWLQWVLFSLLAVGLGPLLPVAWKDVVNFAVPAAFLGLASSMIRERVKAGILVALAAAVAAVLLCLLLPPQISLIVAALIGSGASLLVRERREDEAVHG
jgi:predicted branched-subunit amino acid permease